MERVGVTRYRIRVPDGVPERTLALVSDLHGAEANGQAALAILRAQAPDGILSAGDLLESIIKRKPEEWVQRCNRVGLSFLRECASIAPTFYAFGNHEFNRRQGFHAKGLPMEPKGAGPTVGNLRKIRATGVTLLCNEAVSWEGLLVGGLSGNYGPKKDQPEPGDGESVSDLDWLRFFAAQDGYKLLLCHQPERFLHWMQTNGQGIDLAVAGHAHGGQWRIFGQGIYAPGQGLFPKYTAGIAAGKLVISRGLGGLTRIPRIWNQPEVVMLELRHGEPSAPIKL